MAGPSPESLSVIERAPLPRYAAFSLVVVIGAASIWTGWNDAGASMSVFHNRLFLLSSALVFAIVGVTVALAPWWGKVRVRLIAAQLVIMGIYLGMAVATTDWSSWKIRGWWQGWWTLPFLMTQIHQTLKLLRHGK